MYEIRIKSRTYVRTNNLLTAGRLANQLRSRGYKARIYCVLV